MSCQLFNERIKQDDGSLTVFVRLAVLIVATYYIFFVTFIALLCTEVKYTKAQLSSVKDDMRGLHSYID